ncbi:hypothetical protein CEXT_87291 [Caerostris extrusa]|uniref:Uncharacterized protein n=1 Tax=Caerostris extrusa TaxID=172846 RepID=A0AAV4PQA8_CAEEX|nr:hypothetical protein CEXT_87291 [Caerostris extrusa]
MHALLYVDPQSCWYRLELGPDENWRIVHSEEELNEQNTIIMLTGIDANDIEREGRWVDVGTETLQQRLPPSSRRLWLSQEQILNIKRTILITAEFTLFPVDKEFSNTGSLKFFTIIRSRLRTGNIASGRSGVTAELRSQTPVECQGEITFA